MFFGIDEDAMKNADNDKQGMLDQLEVLGVSEAALFPELDGLARDLTELFRPDLATWIKRIEVGRES